MSDPLQRDIDETREHLADTVDALTGKAEAGAKRSLQIGVPVVVVAIVAIVLWRRRG